jgi:hypothetical protein
MTNPVRDSVTALVEDDGLQYVTINDEHIDDFADKFDDDELGLTPWLWPPFPGPDHDMSPADRLDFFMLGNTINFQFRDPESAAKYTFDGTDHAGAMGMWAALRTAYEDNPDILTADDLASLEEADVDALFPADDDVTLPMIDKRTAILNEVGDVLQAEYGGRFRDVVDAAEPQLYADGDGIIDHFVDNFPSFDDSHAVDGQEVNLYKRAQLAVWMPLGHLQALGHDDTLQVTDQDNFEIAADYHMPNIFEYNGVIDDENREHITAGKPFLASSRGEIERRAAAVYAGRQLADEMDSNGAELDGTLFQGYKDEAEDAHPVHKTVTATDSGIVQYGTTDY